MKLTADPSPTLARQRGILEIANTVEAIQDGRIHIEKINGPFLFRDGGSPAEYGADMQLAIQPSWLEMRIRRPHDHCRKSG